MSKKNMLLMRVSFGGIKDYLLKIWMRTSNDPFVQKLSWYNIASIFGAQL